VNPVLNAVAMAAANNPAAVGGVGGYPGSLGGSLSGTAPGSPARNFSQLGQITQPQGPASQQPSFPGLPAALSSQLQGRQIELLGVSLALRCYRDSVIKAIDYDPYFNLCGS